MLRQAVKSVLSAGNNVQLIKRAPMTTATKEKWDLYAGVLVERLPIVSKSLTPTELEYTVSNTLQRSLILRSFNKSVFLFVATSPTNRIRTKSQVGLRGASREGQAHCRASETRKI